MTSDERMELIHRLRAAGKSEGRMALVGTQVCAKAADALEAALDDAARVERVRAAADEMTERANKKHVSELDDHYWHGVFDACKRIRAALDDPAIDRPSGDNSPKPTIRDIRFKTDAALDWPAQGGDTDG